MFHFEQVYIHLALIFGLSAFFGSLLLSGAVRRLAVKLDITDSPASAPNRKKHKVPVPLLGGVGITLIGLLVGGILWLIRKDMLGDYAVWSGYLGLNLETFRLLYIYLGALIILIGGVLDDIFQFKSKVVFIPSFIGLSVAIFLGNLQIETFSYPFQDIVPNIDAVHYGLAFLWVGSCLAATKFLDGHDGLVSSIGIIALGAICLTAMLDFIQQPLISLLALIWLASIAGFLPFNLPNAKSYLGESGAQIIGFMIGVLSILSGAKIATAGSVLGWFVIDVVLVMLLRMRRGQSPFSGDRTHLHLRLADSRLNKWQVLGFFIGISLISAYVAVFQTTSVKISFIIAQIAFSFVFLRLIKSPSEKVEKK
jgi:UDP-GlcNAc:undecaprenyl-phosphate GlcNAc-1-phosphate transferase